LHYFMQNTLPEYSCHWPQDATTASDLGSWI
jgi:hypothetical protein